MSRRFAALSALCLPAALAGALLIAFTDKTTGIFALRGAAALLPALLPLALLALSLYAKRSFSQELAEGALQLDFSARASFVAAAVTLALAAPALLGEASGHAGLRRVLFFAAAALQLLAAVWFILAAITGKAGDGTALGALWGSIPAAACLLRLLQRFFAAPVNPRDLITVAQLLTLCSCCVVWLRALQHTVYKNEKSLHALYAAALTALWFAAGLSLPLLAANADPLTLLADSATALAGWMFAACCNTNSTKFDKFCGEQDV
ncbi:MAG: hypothetical protein IJP01_01965 [Oscillospiraceae bacterium]|nr:hypothetical protein [Oscillospiraceae bacterium]